MAYTRPGVYVTESQLRATAPRPSSVSTAAFLGTASRGPVTPTLIDSWTSYKSYFGDLVQDHDLGFAVYHYFVNGGRVAYVTRVVGTGASTSSNSSLAYYANNTAASASLMTVNASNPGVWGNGLSLVISAGRQAATASIVPTFNLKVLLDGVEVESWSELSADVASSRYVGEVINNYSSYLTVTNVASATADTGFSYGLGTFVLSNGSDGSSVTTSSYSDSLSTLNEVEGSLLINAVGQSDPSLVQDILTYCETRGTSFAIIDPDPSATTSAAVLSLVDSYPTSGWGAVYYPMLKMIDPMKTGPAAIRNTFPGGAIAGAYSRTDAQRTVAKTPAGYDVDLRNTLGLVTNTTDQFVSAVYDSGVNCLKAVPGAGVVVLGGRTLQTVLPDQYISIRRSLNFVKQAVNDLSRYAIFEPNSPRLWAELSSNISKFLTTFWGQGGLKGTSTGQAFYVVCDDTNNTPTTIENGEVHIEVGIALQYPAEFIVINVAQWAGGSNTVSSI